VPRRTGEDQPSTASTGRTSAGNATDSSSAPRLSAPKDAFRELTYREREILALIAGHRTNPEIANHLRLSQNTVRNHVSNIYTKLQVADWAQAIISAREAGLEQDKL
jgi:DNA-binding NarL/FixJ family response regulator